MDVVAWLATVSVEAKECEDDSGIFWRTWEGERGGGREWEFYCGTANKVPYIHGRVRAESLTTMTAFGSPNEERSGEGYWGFG